MGIYGKRLEVIKNQEVKTRKLKKDYVLMDSIPEHSIYLYSRGNSSVSGSREFRLTYQKGDTALVSGFETALPAKVGGLKVVSGGDNPVIQLDYVEYQSSNSGSTEIDVVAYFMLDGFCLPLTRVIKKLWLSENGNYEAACKDYQYFSVEFSRNVRFRDDRLVLGKGNYKFSENLNCESSNSYQETPSGSYIINDYLVLKQ